MLNPASTSIVVLWLLAFSYLADSVPLGDSDFGTRVKRGIVVRKDSIDTTGNATASDGVKRNATKADKCEDFYSAVCGNWLEKDKFYNSESAKDHFEVLTIDVVENIKSLLELKMDANSSLTPEPAYPEAFRSVKNVYRACMGQNLPDATPLEWFLQTIKTMGPWPMVDDSNWEDSQFDLTSLLANSLTMKGQSPFVEIDIHASDLNPEHSKLRITPSKILGFGANSGHYYQEENSYYKEKVKDYQIYLQEMTKLFKADLEVELDDEEAIERDAEKILELEKTMAMLFEVDVGKTIHSQFQHPRLSDMNRLMPVIDWERLLLTIVPAKMHSYIRSNPYIVINEPGLISELSALIARSSPRIIANFIIAHYAMKRVHMLGPKYAELSKYHSVSGVDLQFDEDDNLNPDKWEICVKVTIALMQHAVSALYSRDNHPKELISMVAQILEDIKAAFADILNESEFIDADTRNEALKKLKYLKAKIGYPDFISNDERLDEFYKGARIDSSMNFPQIQEILHRWKFTQDLSWLIETRDRGFWWENPFHVNAYYVAQLNTISILAGILGRPFIFSDAPAAYNYATIGRIIGHEIGHAFDKKGYTYDHVGREKPEFSNETQAVLDEKYACLISQYESIEISDAEKFVNGTRLNGVSTLSENIADNDGLKAAYRAYKKFLARTGGKDIQFGNRTNEQMFFLGYALHNCEIASIADLNYVIATDPHSPAFARVNIPLQNFDAFAEAFNCPVGSKMNPEKKCSMWGSDAGKKKSKN